MKEFVKITCFIYGTDAEMFMTVIDQGIDSHLEAFTKSEFTIKNNRHILNFHVTELPLLARRLEELETENADSWANDIKDLPEFKGPK